MYVNPITRQISNYVIPELFDKNPQNCIALDPENDEQYVLSFKSVLQGIPTPFEPKQLQSAKSP